MEMSLLMKILYDSLERIGSLNYFLWHSEVLRKQMDQSLSIYWNMNQGTIKRNYRCY